MSEKTADTIKQAGKVQSDPALEMMGELKDSVATSFEVLEKDHKRAEEALRTEIKDVGKALDQEKTERMATAKVLGEKLNTIDRRQIALGVGRDIDGLCLAALDDEDRKNIRQIEWNLAGKKRDGDRFPLLTSPIGSTLVARWLYKSLQIQKRLFRNRDEEAALYADLARYEKALADAFQYEKAAAFVTTTDTLGGHWLPDPVAMELYRLILDASVFGPLATHVPMTTKTLDLPAEGSSSLSVSWGTENTSITDSVPASNAVGKVTLSAARLNGFAASSLEEIQDSAPSLLAWVQAKLTELAGRELDQEILEGTGAPFTGLSDDTNVNSIAAGTDGDTLTYQMLVDMVFKARERASREGARFFMPPEGLAKCVGLVDSQGQPIVQFGNVPNRFAGSLLGFPVEPHSVIRIDRTKGTGTGLANFYFGPPASVVIGDRVGMAWDTSDIPGFRDYSLHMRLVLRVAIAIAVAKAWTRHLDIDVV